MKSEFDDFCDEALGQAFDITGRESFAITGIDHEFQGLFNEFTCDRELVIGGRLGNYTATVLCAFDDFCDVEGLDTSIPLERALEGKRIEISGRNLRISIAAVDSASVTLGLTNPNKGK